MDVSEHFRKYAPHHLRRFIDSLSAIGAWSSHRNPDGTWRVADIWSGKYGWGGRRPDGSMLEIAATEDADALEAGRAEIIHFLASHEEAALEAFVQMAGGLLESVGVPVEPAGRFQVRVLWERFRDRVDRRLGCGTIGGCPESRSTES